MDIGIMIAATAESGNIAEIAREVENLGYESFFIPEHPVIPIGFKTPLPGGGGGTLPEHYGRWFDPFVALSIAAAVTKRVKLGTGICLLPEREPIITAKTIATLDVISGGRVDPRRRRRMASRGDRGARHQLRDAMETAARNRRGATRAMDASRSPAIRASW